MIAKSSNYEKDRDQILITAYGKMAECLKLKSFKDHQIHFLSEYFAKYVYKASHFNKDVDKTIDEFITYVNDFDFKEEDTEVKVRYGGQDEFELLYYLSEYLYLTSKDTTQFYNISLIIDKALNNLKEKDVTKISLLQIKGLIYSYLISSIFIYKSDGELNYDKVKKIQDYAVKTEEILQKLIFEDNMVFYGTVNYSILIISLAFSSISGYLNSEIKSDSNNASLFAIEIFDKFFYTNYNTSPLAIEKEKKDKFNTLNANKNSLDVVLIQNSYIFSSSFIIYTPPTDDIFIKIKDSINVNMEKIKKLLDDSSEGNMKFYKSQDKDNNTIKKEILKRKCELIREISSISDKNDKEKKLKSLENLNKVYIYYNDLIRNDPPDPDKIYTYNDRASPDGIYLFIFLLYDYFVPLIYHDKPDVSKVNRRLFWKRLTDGKQMKYVYDFENSFDGSPVKDDDKREIYAFLRKTHTKDVSDTIIDKMKGDFLIDDLVKFELDFKNNDINIHDNFKEEIFDSSFTDKDVKDLVKAYYARNKMILHLSEERLKNTFPDRKIEPFYLISFANTFFGIKDESRTKYMMKVNKSLIKKNFQDHYEYYHRKHPNRRNHNHNEHHHQSYLFTLQTINLVSPLEVNMILNHINVDNDVLKEILKIFRDKDVSKDLYEFFYRTIMNLYMKYIEGEVTIEMIADISELYGLLSYEAEPRYKIKYKCGLDFSAFLVSDFIHVDKLKDACKIAKENPNFTSSIEDNDKIRDSIAFYEKLKEDFKIAKEYHTFDSLIGFKEMTQVYLDKKIDRHNRHMLHPIIFIYLKRAYFNNTTIGDTTLNDNPDKIILVDSNEPPVEEVFKSLFSEVYSIVTPFVEGNMCHSIEKIDFAVKGAYDSINKIHNPNKYTKNDLEEILKKELEDPDFKDFFNLISKESFLVTIKKALRMEKFDDHKLAFIIVGAAMEVGIAESSAICMANIANLAMKTPGSNKENIKNGIFPLFDSYIKTHGDIITKAKRIIEKIIDKKGKTQVTSGSPAVPSGNSVGGESPNVKEARKRLKKAEEKFKKAEEKFKKETKPTEKAKARIELDKVRIELDKANLSLDKVLSSPSICAVTPSSPAVVGGQGTSSPAPAISGGPSTVTQADVDAAQADVNTANAAKVVAKAELDRANAMAGGEPDRAVKIKDATTLLNNANKTLNNANKTLNKANKKLKDLQPP